MFVLELIPWFLRIQRSLRNISQNLVWKNLSIFKQDTRFPKFGRFSLSFWFLRQTSPCSHLFSGLFKPKQGALSRLPENSADCVSLCICIQCVCMYLCLCLPTYLFLDVFICVCACSCIYIPSQSSAGLRTEKTPRNKGLRRLFITGASLD